MDKIASVKLRIYLILRHRKISERTRVRAFANPAGPWARPLREVGAVSFEPVSFNLSGGAILCVDSV